MNTVDLKAAYDKLNSEVADTKKKLDELQKQCYIARCKYEIADHDRIILTPTINDELYTTFKDLYTYVLPIKITLVQDYKSGWELQELRDNYSGNDLTYQLSDIMNSYRYTEVTDCDYETTVRTRTYKVTAIRLR